MTFLVYEAYLRDLLWKVPWIVASKNELLEFLYISWWNIPQETRFALEDTCEVTFPGRPQNLSTYELNETLQLHFSIKLRYIEVNSEVGRLKSSPLDLMVATTANTTSFKKLHKLILLSHKLLYRKWTFRNLMTRKLILKLLKPVLSR